MAVDNTVWRLPYTGEQIQLAQEHLIPIVGENGNWWRWDIDSASWDDTGVSANGAEGDMKAVMYDPQGKKQDMFAYTDSVASTKMPRAGGAFTGVVSGVSPTSGSTGGFRNIYFGSSAPASTTGANGDVFILME